MLNVFSIIDGSLGLLLLLHMLITLSPANGVMLIVVPFIACLTTQLTL